MCYVVEEGGRYMVLQPTRLTLGEPQVISEIEHLVELSRNADGRDPPEGRVADR